MLDQCESPANIVSGLQKATRSGGLLFLSCSYQWSKKHLIRSSEITRDINEYFDEGWTKIAEDEHEYKHRVNDRYSQLFLSHIVGYKKI